MAETQVLQVPRCLFLFFLLDFMIFLPYVHKIVQKFLIESTVDFHFFFVD